LGVFLYAAYVKMTLMLAMVVVVVAVVVVVVVATATTTDRGAVQIEMWCQNCRKTPKVRCNGW
jgi:hypothetical protein